MAKNIQIFLTAILVSCVYFPFEFFALPGVNTKMATAGVGLLILAFHLATERKSEINKDLLELTVWAVVISFLGFWAVTYNNTSDYVFSSYVVSMWVWLSAAFVACTCIKNVHGKINLLILVDYLVTVCVAQCILALVIDSMPDVKMFVNTYISQGQDFLDAHNVKRLYGIGAQLDVAGTRFAAVLIMMAYAVTNKEWDLSRCHLMVYLLSFFIIAVAGNIIARTTTVGLVIAMMYWIYKFIISPREHSLLLKYLLVASILGVGITVIYYNLDEHFAKHIRFAFEGFFSLVEKGEWIVSSNDKLKTMYVFPDNIKTWLIGDGYMSNPYSDPYYTGPYISGYYMGTDVGYLRFIFYFGLPGMFAFIWYFFRTCKICIAHCPNCTILFYMLLFLNYMIWFKVSTEIFVVFAFLLMAEIEDDSENRLEVVK